MIPNLTLRWLTLSGVLLLLLDGLLVAFIARRACGLAGFRSRHPVVRWLRHGVVLVLVVLASAGTLSAMGRLQASGFLALHAAVALLLAVVGGGRAEPAGQRPGMASALFLGGDKRGRSPTGRLGRILPPVAGWMLVLVLVYLLVLAVGTYAVNWDSQSYRLPRVGYWLQEGRVSLNFANEPRLVYMPANTELFMLWLTSFFPCGYPLVNLAQFLGGCLTLLSLGEFGRLSGLSREGRLLAAFLALGLPVVLLEFATSQSDLFTGGLLNCGLVFFWRSLKGRSRSDGILAGVAIGLALGAKGTVVYWIPGLVLWSAFLFSVYRPGFRRGLGLLATCAVLALLVGGWKYADNWARFGNPFAPAGEIARVRHPGGEEAASTMKFQALSHLWQLVQPDSNPWFLSPILGDAARRGADWIERAAPDTELRNSFRDVRGAYVGNPVFEDIASFGLLVPALLVLGVVADGFRALRRGDHAARLRLSLAAATAAFFLLFFHEMFLNPWNYRYFVILVPFIAVGAAAAWPVGAMGRTALVAAGLVMLLQAITAMDMQNRNSLGGWRSLFSRPGATALFEIQAGQLADASPGARRVAVAVGGNSWLSPYFRHREKRTITFVPLATLQSGHRSPADFLQGAGFDALITEPGLFELRGWPGVTGVSNGLQSPFGKDIFVRIK